MISFEVRFTTSSNFESRLAWSGEALSSARALVRMARSEEEEEEGMEDVGAGEEVA